MFFTRPSYAEDVSIRHEFMPAYSWSSYEHSYGDYVVNDVAAPSISGHYESDSQDCSLSYAFFFTPIFNDPQIPVDLQQVYAHPTRLRLDFSVRPEYKALRIFQNLKNAYRASTSYTPQSRSAGLELEVYPWERTGIDLLLDSTKDEEELNLSNTLGLQGGGSSDEIQRHYGLGLSQYFAENIRIFASYAMLDSEYVSLETRWEEGSPLLTTEVGVETNTDGHELEIGGLYIFRDLFSVHGSYRYHKAESHSETTTSLYDNFPAGESFYDDTIRDRALSVSIGWYWRHATSFRFGAGFSRYELERNYETDQNVVYSWDTWSLHAGVSHYIHRRFGLWLSYEFATRDGDVETWHPEAEGDPRTTFQTNSELHTLQAGVKIAL